MTDMVGKKTVRFKSVLDRVGKSARPTRSRIVALCLLPLILPVLGLLWLIVVPLQGRPFFYRSERMRTPTEGFELLKIRTMTAEPARWSPPGALGGHESSRVTPVGRVLRRYRLDELPQIFNVLKGEIGFIGPRPPLRRHVEARPELYSSVLANIPGITGLATVMVHRREERLLARCSSAMETDNVYVSRCIGVKARLDGIYGRNRSFALDMFILWRTFLAVCPGSARKRARMRLYLPSQIFGRSVAFDSGNLSSA